MRILIIGSGMYVTGRDGTGTGTILSSLAQSSMAFALEEVVVVSQSQESAKAVSDAANRINGILKSSLKYGNHCFHFHVEKRFFLPMN